MKHNGPAKELAALAHHWLSLNGNTLHTGYCKESITTHPDYPALTALTDFLESGGMAYDAVQADASYIQEFNYPLLAHIKQPGDEFLFLVADPGAWQKEHDITKDWSGIVLYAAPGATWHHPENEQRLKSQRKNRLLSVLGILAGILLVAASVYIYPSLWVNIFGLLSLAGLAVSIAALGVELGYQSKLVKQVCGTAGKGGCEKVLGSRFAKGIAGITPADASVLYFAAQLTLYLAGCLYRPLLAGMLPLAVPGIAVVVWSVYTQAVQLKEWCALCLGIAGVLLLQAAVAFIAMDFSALPYAYPSWLFFLAAALLFTLVFIPIKQLISANATYKQQLSTFKKWKGDATLFIAQLEQEPAADITVWEHDLFLGDRDAPLRITVACNPYCGPCAKAHKTLDELLDKYPGKISVQVRLLCNAGNGNDRRTMATKAILQQAVTIKDNHMLQQMLTDWFHHMDMEPWQQQWKTDEAVDVTRLLEQHAHWMDTTGISFTPTFFINGKRMPGRYELKDIEELVPQLAGIFAVQ